MEALRAGNRCHVPGMSQTGTCHSSHRQGADDDVGHVLGVTLRIESSVRGVEVCGQTLQGECRRSSVGVEEEQFSGGDLPRASDTGVR